MIVGLNGVAGSGKDTAALALMAMGYERRSFADPMRTGLLGINPLHATFDQRGYYVGTIDGTTPYGTIINAGA